MGVESSALGANFLWLAGLSGGRDLMKSRMRSFASVFTLGGILVGCSLAVFFLISAINISYGVNSNSVGVFEEATFFNLIPCLNSPITSLQMLRRENGNIKIDLRKLWNSYLAQSPISKLFSWSSFSWLVFIFSMKVDISNASATKALQLELLTKSKGKHQYLVLKITFCDD